jgi:acyl dehydratase
MPINRDAVGRTAGPAEVSWTSADALIYAVGVGAGQQDPLRELAFTTENTEGEPQRILPSYGVLITQRARLRLDVGEFDPARLVHAEQGLTLHRPLPVEGTASVTSTVTGIYDKGSGALVVTESVAVDARSGDPLLTTRSSAFIRGAGGFGGERGPAGRWRPPTREPDLTATVDIPAHQALLYRLSGDHNPLHSDPAFAQRGGFPRPILHGLCTYGYTARILLHELAASEPARVASINGRFTAPVFPGDTLTVSMWSDGDTHLFRTNDSAGTVVIDQGTLITSSAD